MITLGLTALMACETKKHVADGCESDACILTYDTVPQFHHPMLKTPAEDYNPKRPDSYAVFTMPHTITPVVDSCKQGNMAIWCTEDATYLAIVEKQKRTKECYHVSRYSKLRDSQTGETFPIIRTLDYPLGQTYWVESIPGVWHSRVYVFPPLPKHCKVIDIVFGFELKLVNGVPCWVNRNECSRVEIAVLQKQQCIARFKETVVVE